jgi:hypothetical protein
MSCQLSSAIALDCLDQIGGIKTVYISTDFEYTSFTEGATGISAFSGATGDFYQFEVPKDTASYTSTFTVSQTNGTAFFSQALTLNIQHLSTAKRNQIQLLTYNRASRVIFEDNNGAYWLVGLTRGCTVTAGSTVTGTAPGDAIQYTITLTADEPEMEYQLTSLAAIASAQIVYA